MEEPVRQERSMPSARGCKIVCVSDQTEKQKKRKVEVALSCASLEGKIDSHL
jgi:hypothetical protein